MESSPLHHCLHLTLRCSHDATDEAPLHLLKYGSKQWLICRMDRSSPVIIRCCVYQSFAVY